MLAAAQELRATLASCAQLTEEASKLCASAQAQMRDMELTMLQYRAGPLLTARRNIEAARQRASEVLQYLDVSRKVQSVVRAGPAADLNAFLAAVEQLSAALAFLQRYSDRMQTAADALAHTTAVRNDALAQCTSEFTALLKRHATAVPMTAAEPQPLPPRGGSSRNSIISTAAAATASATADLVPEPVLAQLQALATVLLQTNAVACIRSYVEVRRNVLARALSRPLAQLGSREDFARLTWQQLEAKIPHWANGLRLLSRMLPQEARLAAAIYKAQDAPGVLAQVVQPSASALLDVAAGVLGSHKAPEKLFGLLGMHQAVEGCLPNVVAAAAAAAAAATTPPRQQQKQEQQQQGSAKLALAGELEALRGKLVAEARTCFTDLQQAVSGTDAAAAAPPDGTVHPLCASTVAVLKQVMTSESALPVLFDEESASGRASSQAGLAAEARLLDRMTAAARKILDTLLTSLEAGAKAAYSSGSGPAAQQALHMANNMTFLARSINASPELQAVADGWLAVHAEESVRWAKRYHDAAAGPLLGLLRADLKQPAPANVAGDKAARQACKDAWTSISRAVDALLSQGGWAVPDASLREAISDALKSDLMPLYEVRRMDAGMALGRCCLLRGTLQTNSRLVFSLTCYCSLQKLYAKYAKVDFTHSRQKYVRYTPGDLSNRLLSMFEGGGSTSSGGGDLAVGGSLADRGSAAALPLSRTGTSAARGVRRVFSSREGI